MHSLSHRVLRWGVVLAVLPLLAACSPTTTATSSPSSSAPTSAPTAAPTAVAGATAAAVSMTDAMQFSPASLTVAKGTTVTWRNTSQTVHTVTDDPSTAVNKADAVLPPGAQSWNSGNINPGQSFSHTFDTPGTYKYFCTPHETAGMTGTIVVTG